MKRILLVDDSPIQLRILEVLLRDRYEVQMSTSGAEAVRYAKKTHPDLILLDYDMPIQSGKETFEQLQAMEETKDIPVVFLTGVQEKEVVAEVLKLRPKGYLLKPVKQDLLFETIMDILAADGHV